MYNNNNEMVNEKGWQKIRHSIIVNTQPRLPTIKSSKTTISNHPSINQFISSIHLSINSSHPSIHRSIYLIHPSIDQFISSIHPIYLPSKEQSACIEGSSKGHDIESLQIVDIDPLIEITCWKDDDVMMIQALQSVYERQYLTDDIEVVVITCIW